jgi:hypothetical protein
MFIIFFNITISFMGILTIPIDFIQAFLTLGLGKLTVEK